VALRTEEGKLFVQMVIPGTPAATSGKIAPDDEIVAVAEENEPPESLRGMKLQEAVKRPRGPAGTELQVTLVPAGKEVNDEQVIRLIRAQFAQLLLASAVPLPVGSDVPKVEYDRIADGRRVSLSSHRGTILILKFWSSGCGPCMVAIDELLELHPQGLERQEWDGKVISLLVSVDDERTTTLETVEARGWAKESIVWGGGGMEVQLQFGIPGLPWTVVIDQNGKIAAFGIGPEVDVPSVVAKLLTSEEPIEQPTS
jgi:hypothetical protein